MEVSNQPQGGPRESDPAFGQDRDDEDGWGACCRSSLERADARPQMENLRPARAAQGRRTSNPETAIDCRKRDGERQQSGGKPEADRKESSPRRCRGCNKRPAFTAGLQRKMPASAVRDARLGPSMAPPCWIRATRAREPDRVWGAAEGTTACCAGLRCQTRRKVSTRSIYHTHRHEPITK